MMLLPCHLIDDGNYVFEENEPGDCIYIVKKGKVDIFIKDKYVRTIMKHDYYGERWMLTDNYRTATAVANGRVTCWTISKNDFTDISNETMQARMMKRIEMQDEIVRL